MDEKEGKEMSDRGFSDTVDWLKRRSKVMSGAAKNVEGQILVFKAQGTDNNVNDAILKILEEFAHLEAKIADGLLAVNSKAADSEMHFLIIRGHLLKLLGLMPDATDQEIEDALDDVGPIIAGYRKKKRGT